MSTCVICVRTHTGSYACVSCVGALQADLRAVPGLLEELEVTRCRLDNLGADPGRAAETRMVWSERASEAHYVLTTAIGSWARDIHESQGVDLPRATDTASLAGWMERWPARLASHSAIEELDDEIRDAVRLARRAIDRPADTRVFLGRCDLGDPDNPPCDRELYAWRSQDEVECPSCDAVWSVEERRRWLLAHAETETATAEALAALLTRLGVEVTVRDIQAAAKAGRLTNVGIDAHTKRRRYQVGAVLDALLPPRSAA